VSLEDADFLIQPADRRPGALRLSRIVSTLEGGYYFDSLARCVELHLRALMGLN
jgi:acetoin utilization deacetylase AcuC-like enzyme